MDWIAILVPEAVRAKLLTFRPRRAPEIDPLEGDWAKERVAILVAANWVIKDDGRIAPEDFITLGVCLGAIFDPIRKLSNSSMVGSTGSKSSTLPIAIGSYRS